MAQQRVLMGSVTAAIPNGGDETHPIYVKDGKAYQVDKVADSSHADEADHSEVSNKLGTTTVGDPSTPVYIKDGVPTPVKAVSFGSNTSSELVLGDGSTITIEEFIEKNIEKIREALGTVSHDKIGLVPKLPNQQ